ncbi:hypothetical protein E1B28_006079 [Marasmius oreades]|uniref:Uncharacterized protein n=1 Tax=Marasmius oreades TaxID=181124 RepID=A0A9P7UWB3_9AGAR|nr:uncharacterized protein E1B28_006079 [Marasmius oreades]KAG7095314.1 hypothetical protein E1B28_006079 [Marasmius oreades]
MKKYFTISVLVSLLSLTVRPCGAASISNGPSGEVCPGQVVNSEMFIGEHRDVKVEFVTCPQTKRTLGNRAIELRQTPPTNVCGQQCNTNCFTPSGGGPDPNECHIIADALRFDSENIGAIFPIGTGTNNTIVMTFRSCKTFFVNHDLGDLAYCRTDWADVLDFVAFNCQAPQNAHGGNCVAADQRWFIQAQHS